MSITLPPIGAKVRAIRILNGTTVTAEGVITSAYGRGYDTDPDRVPPSIVLDGNEHVSMHDYSVGDGTWKTTVEILSQPEPADGTVVTTGKKVFLRQVTATHGGELSWWRTGDDEPWTWGQVCSTGAPVRLVLESPTTEAGAA